MKIENLIGKYEFVKLFITKFLIQKVYLPAYIVTIYESDKESDSK